MLSESDIKRIANLSRINITPEEEREFSRSISSVLDYVSRLKEAGGGIKNEFSGLADGSGVFRGDNSDAHLIESEYDLINAAPEIENNPAYPAGRYVKVKRIL